MHVESVEIYSDATNAAVMRHPGRRFPGMLIQGDTLHSLRFVDLGGRQRKEGDLPAEGLLGARAPRPFGVAVENDGDQRRRATLSNPVVCLSGVRMCSRFGR